MDRDGARLVVRWLLSVPLSCHPSARCQQVDVVDTPLNGRTSAMCLRRNGFLAALCLTKARAQGSAIT